MRAASDVEVFADSVGELAAECFFVTLRHGGVELRRNFAKDGDDRRIDVVPAVALQNGAGLAKTHRCLVRAARAQRIDHVGHRKDTRRQRNLLPGQSTRVAAAVLLLGFLNG